MNIAEFNRHPLSGWFPGHMLKAGRQIQERLALVDVVVELLDARIPDTSRNPRLEKAFAARPRLLVFNKADLADPEASRDWERRLVAAGESALFLDAQSGAGVADLLPRLRELHDAERSRRGVTRPRLHPLRVMVVGIPNVGKSTLVNRLAARRRTAVGPKPGVTRQQQWVVLAGEAELLDTPGVAWPRVADKCAELKLGLAGTIRDEVLGEELLAEFLWFCLHRSRNAVNWGLYGLAACPPDPESLIEAVALRRGLLRGGGLLDRQRAAEALLHDFRAGRLGRFTLDPPPAAPA